MSIDRDTFENTSEEELEDLSVPDQVLGFLAAHDNRAFKAREIASQVGVDTGAVSTALSRLKDRELVEQIRERVELALEDLEQHGSESVADQ